MSDNGFLDTVSLLDPGLLSYVQDSSLPEPAHQYGFPHPGEQSPSPANHTQKYYFADHAKWKAILEYGDFDDIVVGTGFCGLAYIDKALKLNPKRRILVLERGELWLMTHFQNLDLPFNLLLGNASEMYPWALTSKTYHDDIKFVHGSFPFFGGRSPFWSAFSPKPPLELLRDFPQSMIDTARKKEFWDECRELLHVVEPGDLYDGEYQALQEYIEDQFHDALQDANRSLPNATYGEPADLAVGKSTGISDVVFEKFSTPGPLLNIYERQRQLTKEGKGSPLTIATGVVVERFGVDALDEAKRADVLHTSRGVLSFPRAKKPNVILATGAIPACTIVLNSVKKQRWRAGSRLSGHFLTHINARFPVPQNLKDKFKAEREERLEEKKEREARRETRRQRRPDGPKPPKARDTDPLKVAAYYLAGEAPPPTGTNTRLQYHADITVIHSPDPEKQKEDAARLCPDFFSTPTAAQLKDSQDHVIVACVVMGEIEEGHKKLTDPMEPKIDEDGGDNGRGHEDLEVTRPRVIYQNEEADKTTNIRLMLTMSENELQLRKVMYQTALDCITTMAGSEKSDIEYWHDNGNGTGKWDKSKPSEERDYHMPGVVHEASTLYMDDNLSTHPKLEERMQLEQRTPYPSVDSNYRVYGCGNVYATGAALFPTSGSWNPTLTMCGYAQDLATKLHNIEIFRQVFSMSIVSALVNHFRGTVFQPADSLGERLRNMVTASLPNVPTTKVSGANAIQNVWSVKWGPAVRMRDADDASTRIVNTWYMAYHPDVRYEDGTLHPTYVIAVTGMPSESVNPVTNFDRWVEEGVDRLPASQRLNASSPRPMGAWISFETAKAAFHVLNTAAPRGAEAENTTLLDAIRTANKFDSTRFIFTGHGFGGGVAVALALALVNKDNGILKDYRKNVFTYPTGVPSLGNAAFVDAFQKAFPPRRLDNISSHKGWNLNLVNERDVVPQAWCTDETLKQNLFNISGIHTSPRGKQKVLEAITRMAHTSNSSQIGYRPLPSQCFAGVPASTPPRTEKDATDNLVFQHLQAYFDEVRIDTQSLQEKAEPVPLEFFPVIYTLSV